MAGRIPSTFIDTLISRVDIVDVINRRVPLKAKGKEYMACCPFHDEKTPSFTVNPAKQFYHCFGCGVHGTAIGFLMAYDNLSFPEAVEALAGDLGMDVPREGADEKRAPPGESTDELLHILQEASEWFQRQLHQQAGKKARTYLESRGLNESSGAQFGIGYAPESWDGLLSALGTDPLRRRQLLKVGLVSQKEAARGQDRLYDRFRGRVIFPIEDHRGRVVAFGGRVLGDGEPKYLNSPETVLFHKGQELYGLHRARRALGQAGKSVVVEGYLDVVSLAQGGIDNVVGTLGTATTRTHLQRLFRLAPEIVFCFDGDRAGREAAWRALQVALPEMQDGRQLGFLFLPEGEDPDSFIRHHGAPAFHHAVAEDALPLDRFVFDTLVAQVDMNRMDGKARLVSLAKPLIETMPDSAFRQLMQGRLTELTGIDSGQFIEVARRQTRRPAPRPRSAQPGRNSLMATAISLLLQYPEMALKVVFPDVVTTFQAPGAEHLERVMDCIRKDPNTTTARLLEEFRDTAVYRYMAQLAAYDNQVSDDMVIKVLNDTLSRLQEEQDHQRIDDLLNRQAASGSRLSQAEKQELRILLEQKKARLASG